MKIYAVGGSVRDSLMGVQSCDNDYVVVGSTPEEMISLGFQQVGAAFPVFLHPETQEEYALARTERKVGVGYKGFECVFSPDVTIEEDLSRRDLTINAIARDLDSGELIDPFNGRSDIENGILRHVSDAFAEDPLRVVRLARFYARFYARFDASFIDSETVSLARKIVKSGEMDTISNERYWAEIYKVFDSKDSHPVRFFCALNMFGVLDIPFFKDIFGDWNSYGSSTLEKSINLIGDIELKMAIYISYMERNAPMKFNAIRERVKTLVMHMRLVRETNFYDVQSIYKLISILRSLSKPSGDYEDVLQMLSVWGKSEARYRLEDAVSVCNSVTFDVDLSVLSGKEIGEMMKQKRMAKIDEMWYNKR